MKSLIRLVALVAGLAAFVAASAQDAVIQVSGTNDLGEFLVDAEGLTLYVFTRDSANTSTCYDECAEKWPPFLVEGEPTATEGVDAALVGTITREDGTTQVTYNGWPLYNFIEDEIPNDTYGQAVAAFGGEWFVMSPEGDIKTTGEPRGETGGAQTGGAVTGGAQTGGGGSGN